MNKKQTIRLNESDLNRLVKETVKRVIKENSEWDIDSCANEILNVLNQYGVTSRYMPETVEAAMEQILNNGI